MLAVIQVTDNRSHQSRHDSTPRWARSRATAHSPKAASRYLSCLAATCRVLDLWRLTGLSE